MSRGGIFGDTVPSSSYHVSTARFYRNTTWGMIAAIQSIVCRYHSWLAVTFSSALLPLIASAPSGLTTKSRFSTRTPRSTLSKSHCRRSCVFFFSQQMREKMQERRDFVVRPEGEPKDFGVTSITHVSSSSNSGINAL